MKNYTPEMKVAAARLDLVTNFPVYGSIFLRLNVHEDPDCPTAWTDGVSIGYNLDYTASLSMPQIIGLFTHEVLHVIHKHHLRAAENLKFKAQHRRWNFACDYALNPTIRRTPKMDLHPDWLYESKWDDALAEEIFFQLPEKEEDLRAMCGDPGDQPGEVRPWPGPPQEQGKPHQEKPSKADIDAEGNKVDQWIRAAAMKAQGAGKLGGNEKRLIKGVTTPTVNWEDEIQFMAESISRTDFTWTKPNQSYMQFGVYLPSMTGQQAVDMVFFVDTSGSLSNAQLTEIMGNIRAILDTFWIRVIVVYWDTGYRHHEIFDPEEVLDPAWGLNVKGRGGTNFRNVWDWMYDTMDSADIDPEAIVFFSDLECTRYPDEDPGLPLIWAQVPDWGNSFEHRYLDYLPDYGTRVKIPIYRDDS